MKKPILLKIILSFNFLLFSFTLVHSQNIQINRDCDTLGINKLTPEKIAEEKVFCLMLKDQQVFFTSKKEFDAFYKEGNSGNSNCGQSGLNNFDFDKYNVLLLNYGTPGCDSPIFSYNVFFNSVVYSIYVKVGIRGDCLKSNHISRYLLLPKEKGNQLPKINVCYYDAYKN